MSKWFYPDRQILEWWANFLKEPTIFLSPYLPPIDAGWIDTVLGTMDLLKISFYRDDFHHKAAHLFYKICKDHYFVDSNKRSSIIVLYLFCIVNGYIITCQPEGIRKLAEHTAEIKGSKNYENDIAEIEKKLEEVILPVTSLGK